MLWPDTQILTPCGMQQLERIVSDRQKEFEVRDLAKVLWMFGRAHYNNQTVAALVHALAKRALAPSATAQVRLSTLLHDVLQAPS